MLCCVVRILCIGGKPPPPPPPPVDETLVSLRLGELQSIEVLSHCFLLGTSSVCVLYGDCGWVSYETLSHLYFLNTRQK